MEWRACFVLVFLVGGRFTTALVTITASKLVQNVQEPVRELDTSDQNNTWTTDNLDNTGTTDNLDNARTTDNLDTTRTTDNLDNTRTTVDNLVDTWTSDNLVDSRTGVNSFYFTTFYSLWREQLRNLTSQDSELDPAQMIAQNGYPAESHQVTTEDGYILTVHRIPPRTKGEGQGHPVLLQHGLLASSADWIISGPGHALAYLLSDLGYDVWLGNCRGNTYSRAHVNMSASDSAFWNFTWHEMGYYDLPAVTEFVLGTSGHPQLTYVGHSMGTTMFWVFCTTRPQLQHRVRQMHALAPIAFMSRMKSPLRNLAPIVRELQISLALLGQHEFLSHGGPSNFLVQEFLKINHMAAETSAEYIFFYICGFDPAQFNKTLLPTILGHTPAGASTQSVLHYLQEVKSGKFREYDEGTTAGNVRRYGSPQPPEYDLSQLEVPVAMQYSLNDWLSNTDDVKEMFRKLKNPIGMFQVPLKSFNHLDFMFAKDARRLVYQRVIDLMKVPKTLPWKENGGPDVNNNAFLSRLAPVFNNVRNKLHKAGERKLGQEMVHRWGPGVLTQIERLQSRLRESSDPKVAENKSSSTTVPPPSPLLKVQPAPLVSRMLSTLTHMIERHRDKTASSDVIKRDSCSEGCPCGGAPSHICRANKKPGNN